MSEVMGRLWAGWRNAYVTGAAPVDGCVLCAALASNDAIWRGELCGAVLNAYPYTSGHLMVAPLRHVGELEDLTVDEAAAVWSAVTDGVRALKTAYRPDGINVGLNLGRPAGAGVPGHLHTHALPRWEGDTNFMTALAETRVLPEALPDSLAKLRSAWPRQ